MPCPFHDPFKAARDKDGALVNRFGDEEIPMMLRHADVRATAKDWKTFSSDAPFRVPVPSEEEMRPMRQLPIETNPPEHTAYRALVDPFFRRAKSPEVIAKVEALVTRLFDQAFARDSIEMVHDFALPLQSTALTYLLNVDESESAGGRDTVIHSLTGTIDYFAKNPDQMDYLRAGPKHIVSASEELFRILSPITHIGRVCPMATEVSGQKVAADARISLGWAAANFDEMVFSDPTEVKLDRKPNPHVAFGFGPHLCIGAPHARLLLRTVLQQIADRVASIEIRDATEAVENGPYVRPIGFERLEISLTAR